MPTGTPYHSFVAPYNIRVDDFTDSVDLDKIPSLHLLTHTHSDHVTGLSSKSFAATVICSKDAKSMLLRHEAYYGRALHDAELMVDTVRTFAHLKASDATCNQRRDLLKPIPLNVPTDFILSASETVTITAIDANHCPGAVMYLIEGGRGAVLHTGDFRAEKSFLESITQNPLLQPYIHSDSIENASQRILQAIYLDTACVMANYDIPSKVNATTGLMKLMLLFPEDTFFYINSWTWGYEDILKAIARTFKCKIHVDRYKYSVYTRLSDPLLRSIFTRDASSTRFHACERFDRCEYVNVGANKYGTVSKQGKTVVYVNPVNMSMNKWEEYLDETAAFLKTGKYIANLLCPLGRHSPLPELLKFVSLFRPRNVVPNTLIPSLQNLDWVCIDKMFAPYLYIPPSSKCIDGVDTHLVDHIGKDLDLDDEDTAIKNLIGEGASDLAEQWADSGRVGNRLDVIRHYLVSSLSFNTRASDPAAGSSAVLTTPQAKTQDGHRGPKLNEYDSEEDSQDQRGRTAHILFASKGTAKWAGSAADASSSPSSLAKSPVSNLAQPPPQPQEQTIFYQPLTPDSSPSRHYTRDKGKRKALPEEQSFPALDTPAITAGCQGGSTRVMIELDKNIYVPLDAAASFSTPKRRQYNRQDNSDHSITAEERISKTSFLIRHSDARVGYSGDEGASPTVSPTPLSSKQKPRPVVHSQELHSPSIATPPRLNTTPRKLHFSSEGSPSLVYNIAGSHEALPATPSSNQPLPFLDLSQPRSKIRASLKRSKAAMADASESAFSHKKRKVDFNHPLSDLPPSPSKSERSRKKPPPLTSVSTVPASTSTSQSGASSSSTSPSIHPLSILPQSPSMLLNHLVRKQRMDRRQDIAERVAKVSPELVQSWSRLGGGSRHSDR